MSTQNKSFPIPSSIEEYLQDCPVLDLATTKRVHMQVVIVWAFYNYPHITNQQLSDILMQVFPESSYRDDFNARAKADRAKFNAGVFRCTGGWKPSGTDDPHYAVAVADQD
ncbi:MAG: hypothetical protein H7831_10190 [Magnetococcus sp. WYHC-3]